MKETVVISSAVDIYRCDFCGKVTTDFRMCKMCHKDVCFTCAIVTEDAYLEAGCFTCDCPDYYCSACWNAGRKERDTILALREQKEKEESLLWEQWRKNCIL